MDSGVIVLAWEQSCASKIKSFNPTKYYPKHMKFRSLLLVLSALAIAIPYSNAAHHEEEHTELEESMSQMNKVWRKIKRGVKDPSKNAEMIEYLATVKAKAMEGIDMVPARKADVPAADQEKFMKGYVKEMKSLVKMLGKLEAKLAAGDNEAAIAIVGKIGDHRKESHEAYKRPDED